MPEYENQNNVNANSRTVNPDEVGACWSKENDKGVEYLSIKLKLDGVEYNLKGFLNSRAKASNHPKFIIYKSKNIKKTENNNQF